MTLYNLFLVYKNESINNNNNDLWWNSGGSGGFAFLANVRINDILK